MERGAEERSGGVYWGASNTAGLLETFDSTALGPARLGVKLEVAVLIGLNEAAVSHREVNKHDCHSGLELDLVFWRGAERGARAGRPASSRRRPPRRFGRNEA